LGQTALKHGVSRSTVWRLKQKLISKKPVVPDEGP
jgi:hypothetical protein